MRGPHDVITSVADRARAGVFWPRDGHRANENSGQLNQSAVSNEVAGPWCKQPPDTLHHALRAERNRQLLLRKSKTCLSPYSWVMPHCLSVGIAPQFPVQTIRAINNSGTIKTEIGWKKKQKKKHKTKPEYINNPSSLTRRSVMPVGVGFRWRDRVINYSRVRARKDAINLGRVFEL